MGLSTSVMPDNSVFFTYAFDVALEIVNPLLGCVSPLIFMLAVYNLAGDNLVNWAMDTPPSTYWADLRKSFGILNFTGGVVSSAGDESTNVSLEIVEGLKNLTIGQLQNLKTPYGRQYLGWAQEVGTSWGIS